MLGPSPVRKAGIQVVQDTLYQRAARKALPSFV
jgi:hypothetical protein